MNLVPAWCFEHTLKIQITILTLAVVNFIFGIAKVASQGGVRGRLDIWLIIVCVKSIIALTYEILTQRVYHLQNWASTKANMILNCIEPVFWFTAFVLCSMSISKACRGASCGMGALYIIVTLVLIPLSLCLAVVSISEHRHAQTSMKAGIQV